VKNEIVKIIKRDAYELEHKTANLVNSRTSKTNR
jgi:hypothetical protein